LRGDAAIDDETGAGHDAGARHAWADDRPVEHVERRERGACAVADVIMRRRAGPALLQWQTRLGAVERLDLALLVGNAQHRIQTVILESYDYVTTLVTAGVHDLRQWRALFHL
jgi:hypothetical protein